MGSSLKTIGPKTFAKIRDKTRSLRSDKPIYLSAKYLLNQKLKIESTIAAYRNKSGDRYIFEVWRNKTQPINRRNSNEKPYEEYHFHRLDENMIVRETSLINPKTIGSIEGKHISELLHGDYYKDYQKKFIRCQQTKEPQWCQFYILGYFVISVMIPDPSGGVNVHEACGVNPEDKGRAIFWLKRTATMFRPEDFKKNGTE